VPLVQTAQESLYLSSISPRDRYWDILKTQNENILHLYRDTQYDCYAVRMGTCAGTLIFAFKVDENGLCKLILKNAQFCRVAFCPICQKRRSMKWQAKTFKILPHLIAEYPRARFLMLTLTVKNPHVTDTRDVLAAMHRAWTKLVKRKEWMSAVDGWIRAIEVTRGADRDEDKQIIRHRDDSHPHYHCLLMVKPGYFGKNYINHDKWQELWESCLGIDYPVTVHITAVKGSISVEALQRDVMSAVVEVIKYTTKPDDLLKDVQGSGILTKEQWLVELTTQLFGLKKITTGGVLKKYYKIIEDDDATDMANLIKILDGNVEIEADEDSPRIAVDYSKKEKKYKVRSDD